MHIINQNVFVSDQVIIGDNVKIQNNVSIYNGVQLEDNVFCGPSMVFTNVLNPRSAFSWINEYKKTIVKKGSTLGANCTIICGITIGENSFIGAGSVVTKDVPENCIYAGNPAKFIKKLDAKEFNTRKDFFNDPKKLAYDFDMLDRYSLRENSFMNWIKSIIKPDNTHWHI